MKNKYLVTLMLFSSPLYASSILGSLQDYQETIAPEANTPEAKQPVTNRSESSSETNGRCEENNQVSMPMAYATSLIMKAGGKFDIDFNSRSGKVSLSTPSMISNCSSMVEWKLKEQEVKGKLAYVIEARFKEGENCVDGKCSYKVAKVKNGQFENYEDMSFAPTLKGFDACLEASGVITKGKVDKGAIYSAPMKETFSNVSKTGDLLFVSSGPQAAMIKAKYGEFELINKCDHYEKIHPDIKQLLSYDDEERIRLDEEANKLKDCGIDEYDKLVGFIERYDEYSSVLGSVRDQLILDSVKASAKKISDGKYSEDDLKILGDFEKYIVNPRVEEAKRLYNQMSQMEGDAKRAKQNELKAVLDELKAYNNKPYYQAAHTQKLLADGLFEQAEKVNGIKISLDTYRKLGSKQNNLLITPDVAMVQVVRAKDEFARVSIIEQEKYQVRTGQISGQADHYNGIVGSLQNSINVRTKNYKAEMVAEYSRIQQGGYCYAYFRNTQKCIQDSVERIQQLQNLLNHYNKVDQERIAELDVKAKEYEKLEAEGRRYVAAQNGEEVVEEPSASRPADSTKPPGRNNISDPANTSAVAMDLTGGQNLNAVANQMLQMYQQQMSTQQNQMGQGWWNQQGQGNGLFIQGNAGMNGQMNGQMNMQQNPYQYQNGMNQMYWSNPYQAYNQNMMLYR